MKDMKKTGISILLLTVLALLVAGSCDRGQEDLRIKLEPDYSDVVSRIEQSSRLLAEQMARIESLMRQGFADNQAAIELARQAVAALGGTLDEKLAAVKEAIKAGDSCCCSRHLHRYVGPWTSGWRPLRPSCPAR